jgi:hypothetical protein
MMRTERRMKREWALGAALCACLAALALVLTSPAVTSRTEPILRDDPELTLRAGGSGTFLYLSIPVGDQGTFAPLGFGTPIFASNATHVATLAEYSGESIYVTASTALTPGVLLQIPLLQGSLKYVYNATGYAITVGGSSGSSVAIATAQGQWVNCADGANFTTPPGTGSGLPFCDAGSYYQSDGGTSGVCVAAPAAFPFCDAGSYYASDGGTSGVCVAAPTFDAAFATPPTLGSLEAGAVASSNVVIDGGGALTMCFSNAAVQTASCADVTMTANTWVTIDSFTPTLNSGAVIAERIRAQDYSAASSQTTGSFQRGYLSTDVTEFGDGSVTILTAGQTASGFSQPMTLNGGQSALCDGGACTAGGWNGEFGFQVYVEAGVVVVQGYVDAGAYRMSVSREQDQAK